MPTAVRVLLLILLALIAVAALWTALGTREVGVLVVALTVMLASAAAFALLMRGRPRTS
jgi:hypothetical protein